MNERVLSRRSAEYFASPLIADDDGIAQFMVCEYARGLLEIGSSQCDELPLHPNPAIRSSLANILNQTIPWSVAWTPALGMLEATLVGADGTENLSDAVAMLLIQMSAEGAPFDADIRLQTARAVQWGTIIFKEMDRILFHHENGGALVELYRDGVRGRMVRLERGANTLWSGEGIESRPTVWLGQHPMSFYCGEDAAIYPLSGGRSVLATMPPEAQTIFSEAANLLETFCPPFLAWSGNAVRAIVPLDASDGIRMSATVQKFPGVMFLSFPADPLEVAARLVHEASHQYFFALKRLGRLHDGTDTKSYYSPIKERARSLELTLFAFHAFCNGALFHRALAEKDSRFNTILGQTVDSMSKTLHVLHEHLLETQALTPMGEILWRPLAGSLFNQTNH